MRRLPTDASSSDAAEASGDWIAESAPRALAYARTLVRNEAVAEDLVQDCYQRLLAKADRYDLASDGARLLFKAITNACINRTQRRRPVLSLEQLHPEEKDGGACRDGTPLEKALLGELSDALDAALGELPVEQRAAVELHAMGHSAGDIAEALETTPGNVRVLLHRGRARLAERLKPYLES
ncbi:MAG TPA: RNA polymerase sigma factor [Pirellulaceae bacterium]|nr:RNA polymerase sigma factor [Pirellulaceae bacterium]